MGLSSAWSTSHGIASYIADQIASRLPDDYYLHYPDRVAAETLDAVHTAGSSILADRAAIWIVVGERAGIEKNIRALDLGELRVIDADGNPAG